MDHADQPHRGARAAHSRSLSDQPDAHNAAVDADRRSLGACAQVHLQTGRICTLRHGHRASCVFVLPGQADVSLARHRAAEDW
jgi:hypothetical protein